MTIRTLTASILLLSLAAAAQSQELDNLVHQRHTHKHNEPHPEVVDPNRFTTNRDSPVVLPLPTDQDAFTFVVFGDRTGGPASGVNVLADAVHDTNLLEPDLVMTVGDLIDGYNQTPGWTAQMREFKGIMDELLCPWFPVAGNHDVYWRGPEGQRPRNEHDANYEMHFGPLWYAFEHKNSWFIVLYSDEGNPQTGNKNFRRPEAQRMSPEQFAWLDTTLERTKDADHVFIFLHHPRWLKGGYGDDWDRVHTRLVQAGNVSAVFAGHIHRMRYDGPFDGIEYVTLATVGGGQSGLAPDAGYLHQFHTVTVRKDQIALASIPVGELQDVRDITGELSDEVGRLARQGIVLDSSLKMESSGRVSGVFTLTIRNPTTQDVEANVTPTSVDSRWMFTPDHAHALIPAGGQKVVTVHADRMGSGSSIETPSTIDRAYRRPEVIANLDYLTHGFRYSVPERRIAVPIEVELAAPAKPATERVLSTSRGAIATVDAEQIKLPQGPFTLECWMRARSFSNRVGLIAKTENSEYALFVSKGRPDMSVHLDGRYAVAKPQGTTLETDRWYHLAGVFDGRELRLYIDGKLAASTSASGQRRTNTLPLIIGADVTGDGNAVSTFDGQIDEVRLSASALYTKEFTPQRRLAPTESDVLLLHMDGAQGPYLFDASPNAAHAMIRGKAQIVEP